MKVSLEKLKRYFPELANKSDDFIDGFKEALEAALNNSNKNGSGSKANSDNLKTPKSLIDKEDEQENSEEDTQESSTDNSNQENSDQSDQNNSDNDNSDSSKANSESTKDTSKKDINKSASIGSYEEKDFEEAQKLKDQADKESGNAEDGEDEISGNDIINNTMDQQQKISSNNAKEKQLVKAQKDEIDNWRRDPINQFKQSVKNFFSEEDDERVNSITAPNTRRDSGDPNLVTPGRWKKPKGGLPEVNIYFDQANSNNQHVMDLGEQALSALRPYQEKRLLKLNLYYFAQNVHKEDRHQLSLRTGYTWPDGDNGSSVNPDNIIDHIKQSHVDNVIILTDHKLDKCTKNLILPGAVWMFFYRGAESPTFVQKLKGKKLNKYWII